MILSFPVRLACICLASFFLLHVTFWFLARALGPRLVRACEGLRSSTAANLLLVFRLLPAIISSFLAVLAAVIYSIAEAHEPDERTGIMCLSLALLGATSILLSAGRSLHAAVKLGRYMEQCHRRGAETRIGGSGESLIVIDASAPFFFLAGIVQPRLIAARSVVDSLTREQLEVAIRHEQAHFASRDNLKRLVMLMTPDVVPFVRGFGSMEAEWSRLTEWAADDDAVAGSSTSSVSLAAALVHLARTGSTPQLAPLVNPLMADSEQLAARVDRLLQQDTGVESGVRRGQYLLTVSGLGIAALLTAILLQPGSVSFVHELLEALH